MYDLLLIDIPYVEYSMDTELQAKMYTYRNDCNKIIYKMTGVDAKEKENYYSMGLLCMSAFIKKRIPDVNIKYYHYYQSKVYHQGLFFLVPQPNRNILCKFYYLLSDI